LTAVPLQPGGVSFSGCSSEETLRVFESCGEIKSRLSQDLARLLALLDVLRRSTAFRNTLFELDEPEVVFDGGILNGDANASSRRSSVQGCAFAEAPIRIVTNEGISPRSDPSKGSQMIHLGHQLLGKFRLESVRLPSSLACGAGL
jgi:hypothetical protein